MIADGVVSHFYVLIPGTMVSFLSMNLFKGLKLYHLKRHKGTFTILNLEVSLYRHIYWVVYMTLSKICSFGFFLGSPLPACS